MPPKPKLKPKSKGGRPKGRGKRRGLPGLSPAEASVEPAIELSPLPIWDEDLFNAFVADSPLDSLDTKRSMARAAVLLDIQLRVLRRVIETGKATGLEHRAVTAVVSNLRHILIDLGLTKAKPEGDL